MLSGFSALVVDDESFVLELVSEVLTARGYEVTTASEGMDGICRFRERDYSLVMLDASLQDMGSLEVLTRVRVLDAQVPVVMMVHPGQEPDRDRVAKLGAVFLPKPFSIGLLHTVLELMESQRREWLESQTVAGREALRPLPASPADRRRHLRASVFLYASVVCEGVCRECRIIDISLGGGGLHFLLEDVFPTGSEVIITFPTLPHEEPMSLPAKIVWENRATGHCGAAFIDLDWRTLQRLEAIIIEAITESDRKDNDAQKGDDN